MTYGLLIVADVQSLQPETAESIRRFAEDGGKVVFVNRLPDRAPGLRGAGEGDRRVKRAVEAAVGAGALLVSGPPVGAGMSVLRDWTKGLIERVGFERGLVVRSPRDGLYTLRHRAPDADVLFLTNTYRRESSRTRVDFPVGDRGLWRWDPETGERAPYDRPYDRTGFEVDLRPLESILLVTGAGPNPRADRPPRNAADLSSERTGSRPDDLTASQTADRPDARWAGPSKMAAIESSPGRSIDRSTSHPIGHSGDRIYDRSVDNTLDSPAGHDAIHTSNHRDSLRSGLSIFAPRESSPDMPADRTPDHRRVRSGGHNNDHPTDQAENRSAFHTTEDPLDRPAARLFDPIDNRPDGLLTETPTDISADPPAPHMINTPWTVTFQPIRSTDAFTVTMPELADFTESADPRVRTFSGTAVYRTAFRLGKASFTRLDLGWDNDFISEVELNGRKLGVNWYGSRLFDIRGAVREGDNELVIRYTTTLWNAMGGQPLQPSGLIGPVTRPTKPRSRSSSRAP